MASICGLMGVLQNMYVFEQGYLEKLADALKGDMCSTRMSDIFARRAQNDILGKGEGDNHLTDHFIREGVCKKTCCFAKRR